jgi:hypothetical protein
VCVCGCVGRALKPCLGRCRAGAAGAAQGHAQVTLRTRAQAGGRQPTANARQHPRGAAPQRRCTSCPTLTRAPCVAQALRAAAEPASPVADASAATHAPTLTPAPTRPSPRTAALGRPHKPDPFYREKRAFAALQATRAAEQAACPSVAFPGRCCANTLADGAGRWGWAGANTGAGTGAAGTGGGAQGVLQRAGQDTGHPRGTHGARAAAPRLAYWPHPSPAAAGRAAAATTDSAYRMMYSARRTEPSARRAHPPRHTHTHTHTHTYTRREENHTIFTERRESH